MVEIDLNTHRKIKEKIDDFASGSCVTVSDLKMALGLDEQTITNSLDLMEIDEYVVKAAGNTYCNYKALSVLTARLERFG